MTKEELIKENNILKHRLNDIVFGDDAELGARYLRKIGYIDFDEEEKLYINKHNNEPFWHEDEKEKDYYIKDEELDEYTKQLEYKYNKQKEVLDKIKEKCKEEKEVHFNNGTIINGLAIYILELLEEIE